VIEMNLAEERLGNEKRNKIIKEIKIFFITICIIYNLFKLFKHLLGQEDNQSFAGESRSPEGFLKIPPMLVYRNHSKETEVIGWDTLKAYLENNPKNAIKKCLLNMTKSLLTESKKTPDYIV